ncbi:conserved hypothetical protein [Leishmania mexicana MHOM/GT/2001/U1103]|uniref:Uncharacterized protein n=1 Tax=Leishmania mexicana (strain MHOM/GT/2001/U1103) TaxID=929439 RepID=E9AYG4_LEIMU|nr:conserved hypothetical protein [Leishmania mexicana MHOM/GT/2001/U1103]CBZ28006.1 conserved hypothetical protein [Leishmania mexicana MHOM/GT/2001/U1103]
MDAWFQYALGVGEVIYDMKLHEYEDACASLLLTAAKVAATAEAATDDVNKARRSGKGVHCEHSGLDTTVAPAPAWAAHLQPPALTSSSGGSPLISMCETVSDVPMTSSTTAGSVPSRGAAATPGSRPVADPCTVSGATTALNESCLTHNGSIDHSKTPTLSSSATYLPATFGDCNRRALTLTAGAAASPTEAFGALVEAMQLRKPMRAATLSSQHIDAIQAEADFVFQELDDVFTLQPGDAAAAAAAASTAGVAPRPSPTLPSSTDTRCEPAEDEEECGVAAAQSRPLPAPPPASVADSSDRHLLYGELTSVGVRQLQAISMASSCVVREENGRSSSRDDGVGGAGLLANLSTTMACSCDSSSEPAFGSTPPVNHTVSAPLSCTGDHSHGHGHTSRGAVVVAVDVGSGNGRLLFEWDRLAAAACRRQHTSSPPRHADEGATLVDAAPTAVTLHSTTSASGGTTVATTHAASMHCGNLLAAAYAPLGIASPAAVWRGWLGVGIELVPSRMRIARKALVPHYLNLKQALAAPSAGGGVSAPVTHLDPCPLEATVAADMAASCSPSASLQSGVATHSTAVRSVVGSPVSTGTSVSMTPGCRVQQPSARVLLYEGDALAPGVLSNATLCRFPNPNHHGEPLTLGESYAAHDDGGDVQGWGADSSRFRCTATSTASVPTTAAVMNETGLLESIGSDAHGLGGARTPANMSLASIATVGSSCSACPRLVGQSYYPLCSIEGGPLLTGREEPHLVVFCCGLGFDEAQVRRLCQRLEDMLLRRSATAAETAPSPVGGGPMTYQQLSKDANSFPSHYVRHHHSRMPHSEDAETETSPVDCASPSLTYSEKSKEENIKTGFGIQPMAPTAAVPITGIATGIGAGFASHRHWESVTCVLLLRPMDVLLPTFPLFRYARRVYDTVRQPILAEDTALLLSTGRRSDGSSVPFSVRATPALEGSPGLSAAGCIVESDVWGTTLETTWMNAAPAWVVRFHF